MKMTFRWYGEKDSIPLSYIRQIPCVYGVVTAIYDVPVGEVWHVEKIRKLYESCKANNLSMEVIESVPVHEDIKLGLPSRDRYIQNYAQNIRNLSKVGVKCICYNFMPVFDWLRTNLYTKASDGSFSLSYEHARLSEMDPHALHLPGWDESYSQEQLSDLIDSYKTVSHETLFENLIYFLERIMPVCDECNINMAIHPDDPPWDMFSLPRIITGMDSYDKLFKAVPNIHNGITFCTGSLGASRENDLIYMAKTLAKRIYFAHLRQIKWSGEYDFCESGHITGCGSLDMYNIVKSLSDAGFDGYVRSDHGRDIWGEKGKPGYGLYDRALGACYLYGLFEAIEKGRTING